MTEVTTDFGNISWVVYVTAAYVLVGLSLIGFLLVSLKERDKALQSLKDEGFLAEKN
jgi:heme exporter protein D